MKVDFYLCCHDGVPLQGFYGTADVIPGKTIVGGGSACSSVFFPLRAVMPPGVIDSGRKLSCVQRSPLENVLENVPEWYGRLLYCAKLSCPLTFLPCYSPLLTPGMDSLPTACFFRAYPSNHFALTNLGVILLDTKGRESEGLAFIEKARVQIY